MTQSRDIQRREILGAHVLLTDGFGRQVLPMARALRGMGCRVFVLCPSRWDLGYVSRWPHQRLLGPDARKDPSAFVDRVEDVIRKYQIDVVIPLSDCSAEALSHSKERLSKSCRIAVNDYSVLVKARDKLETMRVCSAQHIPAPKTLLDSIDRESLESCGLTFPVAVKPRRGDSAVGFNRVHTASELFEVLPKLTDRFGPMLVQELIPQTDLQYKCELFMDDSSHLMSAIVFSKIRWYPLDGGSSTLNATVERPDIIATCVKLLGAIGWVGYGDVDLIQDPRENVAKVMEINPRVTGSVKIAFGAGLDFAKQIVSHALGLQVEEQLAYRKGIYLRHFHKDVLWLLRSKDRFRVVPSWFSFRDTTDQILSVRDPLPGLVYTLQVVTRFSEYAKRRSHAS